MITVIYTPEGPVGVVPKVAKAFLDKGVVTEWEGKLYAASKAAVDVMESGAAVCDFCTASFPAGATAHILKTPDFEMSAYLPGSRSTGGGWAACDECYALVEAGDRQKLLHRGIAGSSNPSTPIVREAMRDVQARFWAAYAPDVVDPTVPVEDWFVNSSIDVKRMAEDARMSLRNFQSQLVELAGRGSLQVTRVAVTGPEWPSGFAFKVRILEKNVADVSPSQRRVIAAIERFSTVPVEQHGRVSFSGPGAPPALGHQTHWMEAIEKQFAALKALERMRAAIRQQETARRVMGTEPWEQQMREFAERSPGDMGAVKSDNAINWQFDLEALRRAECYSFSGDALTAIQLAAKSVPHDSPLRADQIPGSGMGWWWFTPPLPIESNSRSPVTHGLLWGWGHRGQEHHLVLTAYTMVEIHGQLEPVPAAMWRWRNGETIHQMLGRQTLDYRTAYGPGGVWHGKEQVGETRTMRTVVDLSLFFLAACAWIQQEILVWSPGHVERHRKKAFAREHRLDQPPGDVKVIALRRVKYDETPTSEPGPPVNWSCRWQVDGHWRNQPHGPKRGERRLTYIHPYIKGPSHLPLKVPKAKVFAVIR